MTTSSPSLREQVSEAMRHRIRSGQMESGSVVYEQSLANQFGVSRTPMRGALRDLAREGLLRKRGRRGFVVRSVDVSPRDYDYEESGEPRLTRDTLRDQTVVALRDKILSGEFEPKTVLREEPLASRLGVSRTPLREALLVLTQEGLVSKVTRGAFEVAQLEAEEVRELYPLRALLEAEALRRSGIPDEDHLEDLERLNDELRSEPIGPNWIQQDNQWHEALVANCGGRHLRSMLKLLREHSLRYELAFLASGVNPKRSTGQHEQILALLRAEELDRACVVLADNMTISMPPLLSWLKDSTGGPPTPS